MTNVSIVITSYNDTRVFHLIEELLKLNPYEIIIADGGSSIEMQDRYKTIHKENVKLYILPGNIAETRYQVQNLIMGDITVFIDTDELPIEGWLNNLIRPIIDDECDFTFGPTKPLKEPNNKFTKYLNDYDEFLYNEIVPHDILKGAMGNSAWRTKLVREVGFDPCLGIGGEDYDLTIRTVLKGYKGKFVKNAILFHDQSGIRTIRKFLKKMFYNYMVGASLAYRKNHILFKRAGESASQNSRFKDPMEIINYILKPFALIFSLMINPWEDKRYCRKEFIDKNNASASDNQYKG